ncbi:nucleoside phosphorylase domain-containing protein [Trichoderma chlorosporum]
MSSSQSVEQKARDKMSYDSYTIAVICAMSFEMSAVRYMLDREHPRLQRKDGDLNTYILGELFGNNIVLACLPGNQGKGSAATVGTNLARTFPAIKLRFLVGIGRGVPSDRHDIRLGDVVVSMPSGQYGGVVQYDLGKETDYGFILKGFLQSPPPLLRSAVETMRSDHLVSDNKIEEYISLMLQKGPRLSVYQQPSIKTDVLFREGYPHEINQPTCDKCNSHNIVARSNRQFPGPEIHYGLVASGDTVMKSSSSTVRRYFGDVLCFEMEAAGLMTEYSCLVIRGISDYADSHKNDSWQYYAAATAAACTKELLSYLQPVEDTTMATTFSPVARENETVLKNVSHFSGTGIQHSGSGDWSVGGDVNIG